MSLGRGLGALIASTSRQTRKFSTQGETGGVAGGGASKLWEIPVSEITSNPRQPRQNFKPEELSALADSIKEHGVLQPLLVTEKPDGGYELVAGERRLRAAKLAGLVTVPALIKTLGDQDKLEVALIENIQREDLNPIEEAFAYQRLTDEFGLTQQMVADKVGKSRPVIANSVRLLDLPAEAQTALIEDRINAGQARALLSLGDRDKQLEVLSSLLGRRVSVREVERVTRNPRTSRRDPNLLYLEDQLREKLGTKVALTQKGERGTIVISYYSKEELGGLIKKICG